MSTFSERLREAMEFRNMKASELCAKTGIGKSSISQYLSGRNDAKQDNLYKIAKVLRVNEAWLMGLDVEKERSHYDDKLATYLAEFAKRSDAKELLQQATTLTNPNYVRLVEYARMLNALQEKGEDF